MKKPIVKISQVIWGIIWEEYFPLKIGDYSIEVSSQKEFNEIKNASESFIVSSENSNDTFIKELSSVAKFKYLEMASDFFKFKYKNEIVGVVVCEAGDWSSYYLRYIYIDKNHRSNKLTIEFVNAIESVLRNYKVDKVICDVSTGNLSQLSRMSDLSFICTGNMLSERFGAMIKMTKFLDEKSLHVFTSHFNQSFKTNKKSGEMTSSVTQ